ncbi:carboxymuconolactone decarboxylase family protein [Enterococcus cecorum]|nr:carboxymuconolactone decarboxylase family protein [Enterococcus cecorum]MCJ0553492.1 carboxymuconolactone decarboxylase family protein [Enterococcus cecorum]MCJ0556591.1 carboxymuconolactone decarboxylase family protein [Enterococcus cecorum]MCJ0562974.1 carboxymuconolactone decarboxylase family protein [Enterococcus cecorum]
MNQKITQDAGRKQLGDFAPDFAHFNDDVLFGENWNIPGIDLKTRCLLTVITLMAQGITDSSLVYHLENAKNHGVSKEEIVAAVTHVAFYAGWPKAWAVFRLAKEVWSEQAASEEAKAQHQASIIFPIGEPNDAYAQYFIGQSYLASITDEQIPVHNVTFEPGCRNNWHIHHAKSGGAQMLICVGGIGIYQEEGKEAVEMHPGDCVNIPAGVKHWHGATKDHWFSHLAMAVPGEDTSNEWLEKVSEEDYLAAQPLSE